MRSPLNLLQTALYERLTGWLSCPVYDAAPQGAAFPYVTLGEDTAVDWSTKTWEGQEVTVTLHVWSRYAGMSETKDIIDTIIQAITGSALIIAGFTTVTCRLDFVHTTRDPDGVTRHGVVRFRLGIAEAS